jgi:hypothetical protein
MAKEVRARLTQAEVRRFLLIQGLIPHRRLVRDLWQRFNEKPEMAAEIKEALKGRREA